MTLLLAVGDCFAAFLMEPVRQELRTRGINVRVAAGAHESELAGLRRQLGSGTLLAAVEDKPAAQRFANEVLAATPTTCVAILGVTPFTRCLAQQAALACVRVVRLDAGVGVFGRPTPHPWADAWCVAGALERQAVLAYGESPGAVAVVGDLVATAVASVPCARDIVPVGLAIVCEHGANSAAELLRSEASDLPILPPPARDASVATWIAYVAAARVLFTDSVGWQRVAVALGVPCVVYHASGLWAPGVALGLVTQSDPAPDSLGPTIQRAARRPRGEREHRAAGVAARIVDVLLAPPQASTVSLPSDGDASGRTLGEDEAALVAMVLQRGTLNSTKGTFVSTFERRFAQWLGRKHAVACASGSAAVHCAIAALGLRAGDEVITTPITDMGAITPILYEGGVPVFADVDPDTLNVTASTLRAQVTPRTRALIVTHLFGLPCDMAPIQQLARELGLVVIEDAAQAFGATCGGQKVGTFGSTAAFSLQQGKHITSGEGGILATDDDELARHVFLFVNKSWGYGDAKPDHYFPALNYRLTELQGAVLVAQLPKLDQTINRRREVAASLRERLAGVPGITLPDDPPHGTHAWWKFAFFVDRDAVEGGGTALAKKMQAAGVACAPHYIQKPAFECALFADWHRSPVTSMPLQNNPRRSLPMPLFRRADYPGSIAALDRVVVLPINERYTAAHVQHVAAVIRAAATELQRA